LRGGVQEGKVPVSMHQPRSQIRTKVPPKHLQASKIGSEALPAGSDLCRTPLCVEPLMTRGGTYFLISHITYLWHPWLSFILASTYFKAAIDKIDTPFSWRFHLECFGELCHHLYRFACKAHLSLSFKLDKQLLATSLSKQYPFMC
jgi:hypothetical protein